jgi:hypothetical protein
MELEKINQFISVLQNETRYIDSKVINEKDEKIKSKMLKQIVLINTISSKIYEFKTNLSHYRDK